MIVHQATDLEVRGSNPCPGSNFSLNLNNNQMLSHDVFGYSGFEMNFGVKQNVLESNGRD